MLALHRSTLVLALLLALGPLLPACGGDDDDSGDTTATSTPPQVPVILVPGVAGSRLVYQPESSAPEEFWAAAERMLLDGDDTFLLDLRLAGDGVSAHLDGKDVKTGDIIRRERIGFESIGVVKEEQVYQPIIDRLARAGYAENISLFLFPFDWRRDIRQEAVRFVDFIDQVRLKTGSAQVDIVAHSMGGLVALTALADPRAETWVRTFITLGVPVLGATKALGVIEFRSFCFTKMIFERHCMTNPTTVQQAILTFPGAHQLLPDPAFDQAVGTPLRIDGVDFGYAQWSVLASNGTLVQAAREFGDNLQTAPASTQTRMVRVAGDTVGTPMRIHRERTEDCPSSGGACVEQWKLWVEYGDGDGTVPLHSADLYNDETGFDRRAGVDNEYVNEVSHMDLVKDEEVLDFIVDTLRDASGRIASTGAVPARALALDDREPFDGMAVTAIGPLWGNITDRQGNTTGPVPGTPPDYAYDGIPGSSYELLGDTQSYFFNREGEYTAEFQVVAPGSAEHDFLAQAAADDAMLQNTLLVQVDRYDDAELDGRRIFRVDAGGQSLAGAKLRLTFSPDDSVDELDLQLDGDGDGEFEAEAPVVACYTCRPDGVRGETPTVPDDTPTVPSGGTEIRQLVRLEDGRLVPDLVQKWEPSADGSTLTLQVQRGVRLPNGEPFDATALAQLLDQNKDLFVNYEYQGTEPVDQVTAIVFLGTSAGEKFLDAASQIEVEVQE
jgi:pimeloyl-ACP methyl ester carboxylesterase